MKKALVYLEKENEKATIDLLEVVNQIDQEAVYESYALCINAEGKEANGYFDHVVRLVQPSLEGYDILNITNAIEELHLREHFDCILIPATSMGRLLAPRLAMRLKVGLVADVTSIRRRPDGEVELVRPAFDGKILAGIVSVSSKPLMMSVRPGVFTDRARQKTVSETITFEPKMMGSSGISRLSIKEKESVADIRDAEVLVSGGGGVTECFGQLQSLADEVHGMVSASRKIVDSQIASRDIQVGQSGKVVSPKLYLALGIYGSMQHFEGLKEVKHIIAVNTDRHAPLCSQADIVVEGDALEFVNKLVARIRRYKETLDLD